MQKTYNASKTILDDHNRKTNNHFEKTVPVKLNTHTDEQFHLNILVQPIRLAAPKEKIAITAATENLEKPFFLSTLTMIATCCDILVEYSTPSKGRMRRKRT
jgi:hypothetical protein